MSLTRWRLVAVGVSVLLGLVPRDSFAGLDRWTPSGPVGGAVLALAVDPTNPLRLVAGTSNGGVLTSDDGGEDWEWSDLTGFQVSNLEFDLRAPADVYAASPAGVFKSSDGGSHWELRNSGLSVTYSRTVAVDPFDSSIVYTGTGGGGIFKSTNGGESWREIGRRSYWDVLALAIDPASSNILYACDTGSVWKSADGGETWTSILTSPRPLQDVVVDPGQPGTVYVSSDRAIYKTSNGGAAWSTFHEDSSSETYVGSLAATSGSERALYVATTSGNLRCELPDGPCIRLGIRAFTKIAISPASPAEVFAGTSSGILRSSDGGRTWLEPKKGFSALRIWSLARSRWGNTYAHTDIGLHRKSDGGGWEAANRGLEETGLVWSLASDTWQPDTAYAGAEFRCPSPFPCIAGGAVFKTTDGGQHWYQTPGSERSFAIAADGWNPGILYAGADYHVLKSTDFGESWTAVANLSVYSLALARPSTVLAGTVRGVYRSSDAGASWQPIGLGKYSVLALAVDPGNPLEIYAGTRRGVLKTVDGGRNWRLLGGLLQHVTCLQLDPVTPKVLYAGTYAAGVFRTSDRGATWMEFNEGLSPKSVTGLAIDDSGTRLFAGTSSGGVFEYRIGPKSPTAAVQLPASFRIPASSSP
jgi:photosystem II stability/assembly factor-like uncharacterized protein